MAAGMNVMDSLGKVAKPGVAPSKAGDDAVVDVAAAERSAATDGGAAAEARAEEVQARHWPQTAQDCTEQHIIMPPGACDCPWLGSSCGRVCLNAEA